MTTQFRLQPDELDRIAADIDAVYAGDYRQAVVGLQRVNQAIAGAWIGGSSQAFDALHAGWIARLELIGQELPRVATFLRAAAAEYRQRDGERTAAMFTTHTAHGDRGSAGLPPQASDPNRYTDGAPNGRNPWPNTPLYNYLARYYGAEWPALYRAWQADPAFLALLSSLTVGDRVSFPGDPSSTFMFGEEGGVGRTGRFYLVDEQTGLPVDLRNWQGRMPFIVIDQFGRFKPDPASNFGARTGLISGAFMATPPVYQPIYDYSKSPPIFTGQWREYQVVKTAELSETSLVNALGVGVAAGGTYAVTVQQAVALGILSSGALANGLLLGGTVLIGVDAVDAAGSVIAEMYFVGTRPANFWIPPPPSHNPTQPAPVPEPPRPIQRNPNGPNFPAPPGATYVPKPGATPVPFPP